MQKGCVEVVGERMAIGSEPYCAACVFIACAFLAGCAAATSSPTVFADPGAYQFSSCENLTVKRKEWTDKEQELRLLENKAEEGTGGAVVSVFAYKSDHVRATEELKLIESAARAKNCNSWGSNSAVQ
jgi:hypothetical protein